MIHFLQIEQVLKIHDKLIDQYGGLKGVRDIGLLESALHMPAVGIGGRYLHRTVYDKAGAYLFYITMNHPFNDGNKRTAVMCAMTFLSSNSSTFAILGPDLEELVLNVANNQMGKKEVCRFFHKAHQAVSPPRR